MEFKGPDYQVLERKDFKTNLSETVKSQVEKQFIGELGSLKGQILNVSSDVETVHVDMDKVQIYLKSIKNLSFDKIKEKGGARAISIQLVLKKLGYNTGVVDGVYGNTTAKAVKKFQKDNNLKANDGSAGSETIIELLDQLAKIAPKETKVVAASASAKKTTEIKKAPAEGSEEYLRSLGKSTINNLKNDVVSSYEANLKLQKSILNYFYNKATVLGDEIEGIYNDVNTLVASLPGKYIQFEQKTNKLIADGIEYAIDYAKDQMYLTIGETIYYVKATKNGLIYLNAKKEEFKKETILAMYKMGKALEAKAIAAGKSYIEINNDVNALIASLPGKYIQFQEKTNKLIADGVEYAIDYAKDAVYLKIGTLVYTVKVIDKKISYYNQKGKEVAFNLIKSAQKTLLQVNQDLKADLELRRKYNELVMQGLKNSRYSTIDYIVKTHEIIVDKIHYTSVESYKQYLKQNKLQDPDNWAKQ